LPLIRIVAVIFDVTHCYVARMITVLLYLTLSRNTEFDKDLGTILYRNVISFATCSRVG